MAKVKGPLMSLEASGSIANTLVFSIWKGRPYVRELVTPSNPSSAGQIAVRKVLGSVAKAARAVLTQNNDVAGVGSPFYVAARDGAPSGQSWISYLQKHAQDVYDKTITQWALIDGTEQGYFTTEAGVLGLSNYTPTLGGGSVTGLTAGQQLMALAYFAQDYLSEDVGDILGTSPTNSDVQDFGAFVGETTP
jgi:hypothetical protein